MNDTALYTKGVVLIAAAQEYWEAYQREHSPAAVVWLKAETGQFVLFSRGEYLNRIMAVVDHINATEQPLEHLFEVDA